MKNKHDGNFGRKQLRYVAAANTHKKEVDSLKEITVKKM